MPNLIVYGNPVTEETPVLTYKQVLPAFGGLVAVNAELVRVVTASTLYTKNLVETAQRMGLADELVAAGTSYGTGWRLTASESLGADGGFETVRLKYGKPNVSPLDYGNPAGVTYALGDDSAVVKWRGSPEITYHAARAREGFALVDGGSAGVAAWVLPVKNNVNRGNGMGGNNAFEYEAGAGKSSPIYGYAYNLTLGGEVVAQAVEPPQIVRYGFSYYPPFGFDGAPRRIVKWYGGTYASAAEARTAGLAEYAANFKPAVVANAAAAKAVKDAGGVVLGYTAVEDGDDGGVAVEKRGTLFGEDAWGFTLWMKATESYILARDLYVQNRWADSDRYRFENPPARPLARAAWTVDEEEDTATCAVGGGVLLGLPAEASDSSSSGSGA